MAKPGKSKALEMWNQVPKDQQEAILASAFCRQCKMTTIKDFSVEKSGPDIVLKGKCAKCNGPVARLVENPDY